MDPFSTVLIDRDTTYAFMLEAEKRGHEVFACLIGELDQRMDRSYATARRVTVQNDPDEPFRVLDETVVRLEDVDAVFMRKDPPFDMDYIYATYLLEGVDPSRTLVINKPSGLREVNEKAFIMNYPGLIPDTLITRRAGEINRFIDENDGRCIVKPLDGNGGAGVFLVRRDDPNRSSLLETSTNFGSRHVMCQAYVPEASIGDKRIIIIDGKPVGATLRIPPKGELRGNIHVGAICVKAALTPRDLEICAALEPAFREHGIYFAGIDVLGDLLSEINVTSPTGIQEINRLDGVCLEAQMWEWVERSLGSS
jgi:glutathione synthase